VLDDCKALSNRQYFLDGFVPRTLYHEYPFDETTGTTEEGSRGLLPRHSIDPDSSTRNFQD
jgi:hypothetical protein